MTRPALLGRRGGGIESGVPRQRDTSSEIEHRGPGKGSGPQEVGEMTGLLERLLAIVNTRTFAMLYDDITVAMTYDTGDGADARLILNAMDDHARHEGYACADDLVAHHRGEN